MHHRRMAIATRACVLACLLGTTIYTPGGASAQPAPTGVPPGASRFPYQKQTSDTDNYDAPDPHSVPLEVRVEQLNKEVDDLRDSRERDEAKLRELIVGLNTITNALQHGR